MGRQSLIVPLKRTRACLFPRSWSSCPAMDRAISEIPFAGDWSTAVRDDTVLSRGCEEVSSRFFQQSPQRGDPVPKCHIWGTNTANSWLLAGESTAPGFSVPNNLINTTCFSNPRDCYQRPSLGTAHMALDFCYSVETSSRTPARQ